MSNKQVPRRTAAAAARKAAAALTATVQVLSVEETEKPDFSLPRTAVKAREVFVTGTVDQVARNLPVVPLSAEVSLPEIPNGTPSYNDKWTDYAYRVIGHSAICTHLNKEYTRLKDTRGRRAILTSQALLVALFLNALNQRSMNMTDVRDTLFARITPTGRRLLDVPNRDQPARFQDQLAWDERNHALVRRAFHRMLQCIDPETIPRNRNMEWAEAEALRKPLPAEEQERRMSTLTWVVNRLLETVSGQLPDSVQQRRRALGEDFGIDATPMELFARGRGVHNTETSADPCGGYYFRKADHRDPNETKDRFTRTTEKLIYALDVHLMVAADASHPDRSYYPSIPFRMTADRPGFKPGAAARRMFATIDTSQHNLRYLAGDRLYTNLLADNFQIPARDMGFGLVLAYGKNESGNQHSHDSGMRLVDGTYYGPCMPDNLDTLTEDLRTKKIDLKTYTDSIKQRVQFRMRQKQKATATTQERLGCPASGANPIAICALKPTSQAPRPTKQDDGSIADTRPVIRHTNVLTNGKAPVVCTKDSVTVTATDGAKFRQPLQYGSVLHARVYNALRQGQEGVHGSVKDKAQEAFDAPSRRRVRGLAAQQLFASILLAAVATRRIKTFLVNARRDEKGDQYVPKTLRTDDHATTNMPPGIGETGTEIPEPEK